MYGLWLQADRPIPGLRPVSADVVPDLQVSFRGMPAWLDSQSEPDSPPWYVSSSHDVQGRPGLRVWRIDEDAFFWFRYRDGSSFLLDRAGSRIWAAWPPSITLDDVATYLLGPVLGFVLRLRGVPCLHASAVAVGSQALALVGPARAGKSTTAAALAQRSCAVLSEDVVALTRASHTFLVHPGYTYIRLWPQSVGLLFGSPDALPRLAPPWDKRYLDLPEKGYALQTEPLPLCAVYILGPRTDDLDAPLVKAVSLREGVMTLVANTYGTRLLDERQRAQEFEFLGCLAAGVPLRRVIPHADPARLARLCDVILEDFQGLVRDRPETAARF